MRFNPIAREIVCKIVLYGPGLAGKTSNMQWVRDHVAPDQVSELVSVDTHSERTLHFDWLAIELGQIQNVNVRFEFFTVPGQNYYAATRRQVLQGADGVVFVADSRREALDENIDSMNEMLNNLRHHGLPDDLPVVMQYNKQDLPTALRREQLEPLMNVRGWPSFASTAITGVGVLDTARAICRLVSERTERQEIPLLKEQQASGAHAAGQSWLISCWRCQTILEVPTADLGSVYTCGVCGSTLEVIDSERGLTKAPAASHDDSGGYQMHGTVAPDQGLSALGARPMPIQTQTATESGSGFEVDGYDLIATLDESVQGRRVRVRERATGRNLRALTVAPTLMRQPSYRDNLEPYVRMAGPIKHPNVLALINLRPLSDSAVLFSIDPPDHEPLAHVLARRRALAPPHAMGLLRQMALALEESARHGVVHGWLRPDVVLVSPDGSVLIDELCLPKNHRFLVRELSGASAATEYYLAPEHLGDETRSDLRSDIFSLGALLFRMITGEGLVTGYSAHEALHKIIANGPRPLRSTQAGVSRDMDLFFQRLVATERKDRFQSYREVIEALDRFGGGAKRQTLRLTGTAAISSNAAARGRASAGAHIARRASGGSGNYAGRPRPPGVPATATIRRKSDPTLMIVLLMTTVVVVVVVLFLLVNGMKPQAQAQQGPTGQQVIDQAKTRTYTPPPASSTASSTGGASPSSSGTGSLTVPAVVASTGGASQPSGPNIGPIGNAAPTTVEERSDLLHRIADLRTTQHYQEALDAATHLGTDAERKDFHDQILAERDARRAAIESQAVAANDLETVRQLVQPAITAWGTQGDADWANTLLAKTRERLQNGPPAQANPASQPADNGNPPPATAPQPDGATSPISGQPIHRVGDIQDTAPNGAPVTPVIPPVGDPVALASAIVEESLQKGSPIQALQALNTLQGSQVEVKALHHAIEWWGKRADMIARAVKGGKVTMRIPNPSSNEAWDVVGADNDNLEVASPAGSRTTLQWQLFNVHDVAKIMQAAADAADATAEDNAIAVTMCLLADDPVQANLQIHTHRQMLDADTAAELEALVSLHKRREMLTVLARANEAVKGGNAHGLSDALDELRRADKAVQAALAPQILQLQQALKLLTQRPAAPTGGGTPRNDNQTFNSNDDLDSLPDRDGHWLVNGGMVTNQDAPARLGRADLGNAKSVGIRFQAQVAKGTMTIDFRGAHVVFDFANSTLTVGHGKPRGIGLLSKVTYPLLLERKDDSHTALQFSNGAESADIPVTDLSDSLVLSVEDGAVVSMDDLEITRDAAGPSMAEKQKRLKGIGWDGIANAYLEAPAIVLPASPGVPSGIATPLRDNIKGYSLDAKGAGNLIFRLVRKEPGKEEIFAEISCELPKNPNEFETFVARYSDKGFGIYDAKGGELKTQQISDHFTHLVIIATNQATIASTPQPIYSSP